MRKELLERFLRYVAFDTQSDPTSKTFPSTVKQLDLLKHLVEEMKEMGLTEVEIDEHGYAMGTIPASAGCENEDVIGFISHVDTAPDISGANVNPKIWENYDGGDLKLNDEYTLSPVDFPELEKFIGHTVITTDGTTLLGADNKAGVAAIMTAADHLMKNPSIKHGKIRIGFTPDEEIGAGVDYFSVEKFGAKYAYTIDGGIEGEIQYENFNAAGATITIEGRNIHPGSAKDKMISAIQVAAEINNMLPPMERPEHTVDYQGFYLVTSLKGTVDKATMQMIIRDHSTEKFELKKKHLQSVVDMINSRFDTERVHLEMKDQYYNMRKMVEPHPEIINRAIKAMEALNITPIIEPIRGGTDGSRLSYMNLPCPNIFTGGMNFHGRFEYCSLDMMERATQTIVNIAKCQKCNQ